MCVIGFCLKFPRQPFHIDAPAGFCTKQAAGVVAAARLGVEAAKEPLLGALYPSTSRQET